LFASRKKKKGPRKRGWKKRKEITILLWEGGCTTRKRGDRGQKRKKKLVMMWVGDEDGW